MVVGLDKFRQHFSGHESQYVIIGGTACDLLFQEAGLEFRATKDIDLVLCVEMLDPAFGKAFEGFLEAGGYEARERGSGWKDFYRFHRPKDRTYPHMIELFATKPDSLVIQEGSELTPIPFEDDIESLSAILLNEDYYLALRSGIRLVDGVSVLGETLLIPFKVRAFLDLAKRKENGESIDSKSIKKHRNDVIRLVQLLKRGDIFAVTDPIKTDLREFVDILSKDSSFDPKSLDVTIPRHTILDLLQSVYEV